MKALVTRAAQTTTTGARKRLLAAALRRFAEDGAVGVNLDDVRREAGVSVGALYHHFGDKRAILLELIDEWGDRLAANRRSDLQLEAFLGGDPRAAVAGILKRVYDRVQSRNWLYVEIFRLLDRDAEVRRRYEHLEHAGAEILAGLIEFGQRRGLLRRRPDPMTAGFLMLNAIELLVGHVVRHERPAGDVERVLDELTDMLCRYLVEDA